MAWRALLPTSPFLSQGNKCLHSAAFTLAPWLGFAGSALWALPRASWWLMPTYAAGRRAANQTKAELGRCCGRRAPSLLGALSPLGPPGSAASRRPPQQRQHRSRIYCLIVPCISLGEERSVGSYICIPMRRGGVGGGGGRLAEAELPTLRTDGTEGEARGEWNAQRRNSTRRGEAAQAGANFSRAPRHPWGRPRHIPPPPPQSFPCSLLIAHAGPPIPLIVDSNRTECCPRAVRGLPRPARRACSPGHTRELTPGFKGMGRDLAAPNRHPYLARDLVLLYTHRYA